YNGLLYEKGRYKGYDVRSAENKRRLDTNRRDNHGQQPPFKRQNTGGQNVAIAYTAGNNETGGYEGSPSQPFNFLKTCRFIFLLVPGSSGGGGKSLPSGFLVWGRPVTGFEAWREKRLHSATVFQTLGTG
nr:hypothetical protein [Tanacetum cinerariifolium]